MIGKILDTDKNKRWNTIAIFYSDIVLLIKFMLLLPG